MVSVAEDVEVVEFTDPVCSYAWGTEPKRRRLLWQYGHRLRWRRVMVGMHAPGWADWTGFAPDSPELREQASEYWKGVAELTGMPYPSPLRHLHRDTEEMSRLVKAAERQDGPAARGRVSGALLRRFRESVLVHGDAADTVERGLALARGVPGLDVGRLARDVADPETRAAYQADWEEARRPNEFVRSIPDERAGFGRAQPSGDRLRFGIPCMILTGPAGEITVAGWQGWQPWEAALEKVAPGITADARPLPTPAQAFATWPLLARPELDELCGPGSEPPPGAVRHAWAGGEVWLAQG